MKKKTIAATLTLVAMATTALAQHKELDSGTHEKLPAELRVDDGFLIDELVMRAVPTEAFALEPLEGTFVPAPYLD